LAAAGEITDAVVETVLTDPTSQSRGVLTTTFATTTATMQRERMNRRARSSRLGSIGIGDIGAIAFEFDDWEDLYLSAIYPLMVARGLPHCHATISRPFTRPDMCVNANVWTELTTAHRNGCEIWNHSATHTWSAGMNVADEVTTADAEIRAAMGNAVSIPAWVFPGCGSVDGINITTGGGPIADWALYDTPAAQLVQQLYPVSEFVGPGANKRTFPAGIMHGGHHQTIGEGGVTLAVAKGFIDEAVRTKIGFNLMLHPGNLIGIAGGQSGTYYMSLADFEALLDYAKAYQDDGRLEILSPSGLYYADHTTNRLNIEPRGDFADATTNDTYWSRWGATVETNGGHSGARYLRVAYGLGGVYRSINGVDSNYNLGGQAMVLEAWCRSNGTGPNPGTGVPGIRLQGESGFNHMDIQPVQQAVPMTVWTKIRVPFILHPDQNVLTYNLVRASGNDGVDFDDVRIMAV